MKQEALRYLRNQGGSVTIKQFKEDFMPVGAELMEELRKNGYVTVKVFRVILNK